MLFILIEILFQIVLIYNFQPQQTTVQMDQGNLNVGISARMAKLFQNFGCITMGSYVLTYNPLLFFILSMLYVILYFKEEISLVISYFVIEFDKSKKKKNLDSINLDTISDADFTDEL